MRLFDYDISTTKDLTSPSYNDVDLVLSVPEFLSLKRLKSFTYFLNHTVDLHAGSSDQPIAVNLHRRIPSL